MQRHDPTVLLVSDDPAAARRIRTALAEVSDETWILEQVDRLADGVVRLKRKGIAAVLLELFLPDSRGIRTFEALLAVEPLVPILILTDRRNETLARQATRCGAQDHLLKDHLDAFWVPRILRYAIERKSAEEAFFLEKERADVTLNSIGDAVLSTDIDGDVTYLNTVAESMTGWSREEAIGRPLADVFKIINGDSREIAPDPLALAIKQNKAVGLAANSILICRNGIESAIEDSAAPIRDRAGHVTGAVIVFHDISVAKATRQKMAHLAQHDILTDLPNRLLLSDRVNSAIALARRRHKKCAVLFLDLDQFKNINDSLGHPTGDKLLQSVAKRLVDCLRASDTVSRQGGDEFVILLSEMEHSKDAAGSAKKALRAVAAPHRIDRQDFHITASIGMSIYPDDGGDAENLIRCADTAMYHAKKKGRNNYQFFTKDMKARAVERQFIEGSLRRALELDEFVLHYQPKINLATGGISGVEALIRWHHLDRGMMLPAQFVHIAEECGLIMPIGQWVLREACAQAQNWIDAGLPPLPVSVNISPIEFRSKGFVKGVRTVLDDTRFKPRYLEMELTESALMPDAGFSNASLITLKALGVRLAIDDFGTGYSSLSYLRQFPIDTLKIDQSFIREINSSSRNNTIVSAIINMANSLNQTVVAEGVETEEQLGFLRRQRCEEGQGYYFSAPVRDSEFVNLLDTKTERVSEVIGATARAGR